MTIVDRKFRQQSPDPQGEDIYPKLLCEFFSRDALVVLGDPGAGKTTSFEQAASEEPDAVNYMSGFRSRLINTGSQY